ncbi:MULTISPECIES: aspartyl-phosphate phosphatase Spo0E family protein [Priestia]|jgi:hypothetical protein|uniref:Spo0E like sporulation regulatory protein n=2 Tax=Priestia TaxID=2800373 RepID=A0A1I6AC58_9BACI|nr:MULTISPECIES: aspartyl-phosphate phosphatase Spo0E family protein [Priestia]SFQ66210.1 Spo0E like sporulation regulatory protein [Priestia endophytica DSM 13796]
MSVSKQEMLLKIEKKRSELAKIVQHTGLNSDPALQGSQELDHLLNQYNKLYEQHLHTMNYSKKMFQ